MNAVVEEQFRRIKRNLRVKLAVVPDETPSESAQHRIATGLFALVEAWPDKPSGDVAAEAKIMLAAARRWGDPNGRDVEKWWWDVGWAADDVLALRAGAVLNHQREPE